MMARLVLTLLPAAFALLYRARARTERNARAAAEQRAASLEAVSGALPAAVPPERDPIVSRQLLGVLSHELRSPISAILGYQELLAEGIFGPIDPRADEALGRIRHSAVQLLNLTDGIVELAGRNRDEPEIVSVEIDPLIAESVEHLSSEGAGRGATIHHIPGESLEPRSTDRDRLRRILDLILAAAVKAAPDARLTVGAHTDGSATRIVIAGARLDAARDLPGGDGEPVRTGVALRLAMAGRAAEALGTRLHFDPHDDGSTRITVHLPDRRG